MVSGYLTNYLSLSVAEDLGGFFQIIKMRGAERDAYKILFFWYRTPEILHRFDPKVPRVCWRCLGDIGLHFHIFWECPLIQPFWSSTQAHLQDLLEINLLLDPIYYLLGLPFPGISKLTQKLAAFILLAAKRAIPLRWLSSSPPTLSQALQILEQIRRMEHLTEAVHDSLPQFLKILDLWDHSELKHGAIPIRPI